MTPRRASTLFAGFVLLFGERAAFADCVPGSRVSTCIDSDNLWFKAGAAQFLSIGGGTLAPPRQFAFGVMTSYQSRPLTLRVPSSDPAGTSTPIVDNQINTTFLWALGLGRGLEVTAALPITLLQDGYGAQTLTDQQPKPLVRTATRDARLGGALAILPRPSTTTEGAAVIARAEIVLPIGDETIFAGGRGFAGVPSLSAEYRSGPWTVAAEVGARLRQTVDLAGTRIGSQLTEAIGGSFEILDRDRLQVGAEVFSLQSLAKQSTLVRDPQTGALVDAGTRNPNMPTEWLASVRSAPALAGDVSFHVGGGGAIPLSDNAATQPRFRFVAGLRYAPLGRDRDGDGVLDRDDQCPDQPEDRDGFQDEDGCPDPDNDRDGILDKDDKCRDAPEDFDGFQDEDGCPDLDDDGDGIPDTEDQCRMEPEDKDGFEDEDGCPDPDNDRDGIADKDDVCPNGPEDFDGFKDEDGCPDPDNDLDRILDAADKCPNEAEDYDGFEDEDGCPEPDNDHDGILDKDDKCPNVPETINGIEDEDGCPEPNATDKAKVVGRRVEVEPPLRFSAGDAKVPPELARGLRMAAQKARGVAGFERIIVEVYGDAGTAVVQQDALAIKRADAVKAALLAGGTAADRLTVAAGDSSAKRVPASPHVEVTIVLARPAPPPEIKRPPPIPSPRRDPRPSLPAGGK